MGWRKEVNIVDWVNQYADRRYGENDKLRLVWDLLINSVYSPEQGGGSGVMAYEPRLSQYNRPDYIDIVGEAVRLYLEVGLQDLKVMNVGFEGNERYHQSSPS